MLLDNMDMQEHPLVSVPVITYNSAKTVVETLDSIYNQTYSNIELIISDDCSTDDTISICRGWVAQHKERFVRTEIITVEKNTGVSANMNRAINACLGEWIKGIAGDDIFVQNAIVEYVNYVSNHKDIYWCFAQATCFGIDERQVAISQKNHDIDFYNWDKNHLLDYMYLSGGCPMFSPTVFINRNKLFESGIKADIRVRNAEDRVMWIRMLEYGFKMGFVDMPLVKYRISENSLSQRKKLPPSMVLANQQFNKYYTIPYIWRKGYKWLAIRLYMINEREMKKSLFWKIICKVVKIIFGPVPTIESVFNIRYAYWINNNVNN